MKENDSPSTQTSAKMLNWILALAIALVACAIGLVGWNCIESVQKNAGKLNNYHVTADNTKIDSHRYDVVKKELDSQVFSDQLTASQELQGALVKQEGSEIFFSKGTAAIDKKQYAQGVVNFSQVLALIPVEAKKKDTWFCFGCLTHRPTYIMWALRQRGLCYVEMGHYSAAIADLNAAIKQRSDDPACYRYRARAYSKIGKPALAAADGQTARALAAKDHTGQLF
jgi:predicted Zn-dependent protease